MTSPRLRYLMLACGLAGCAPEAEREPAALAELCGAHEPFRLISLSEGQTVGDGLQSFAGRIYYTVANEKRVPGPNEISGHMLWSTGPCGEDPRPIAEDVTSTFHDERWPDLLLGCREAQRDIVSIDPAGAAPPHVVFTDIDCEFMVRTSQGYVSRVLDYPFVTLHRYPDDPRSETSEPRAVLGPATYPDYVGGVAVRGDSVFMLLEQTLVRIDLADMRETVEQTDVWAFALSPDARYLLWQDITPLSGPSGTLQSVVFLRDRITGDGQALAQTLLEYQLTAFALSEHGLMSLRLADGKFRVYTLPDLGFVNLPGRYELRAPLADGRWLLQRGTNGRLLVADPQAIVEDTPLFGNAIVLEIRDDGVLAMAQPDGDIADEGPLWWVPLDGGPPRLLAERVGKHYRLDGQRLLTTVAVDQRLLGDLVLVDLDTGAGGFVDELVGAETFWTDRDLGDDIVQYRLFDRERIGVWLVRLPAGE